MIEKILEKTETDSHKIDTLDEVELKELAEELLNSLGYSLLLGLINAVVVYLGSKEVTKNITAVCDNVNTPATLIIKHLNNMRNANFLDIDTMKSDLEESSFCFITNRMMKYFVIEHCAYRPLRQPELQRISSKLDIDLNILTNRRRIS